MTIPLSVYLHIPFCRTKCTYCAFNTYIKLDTLINPFIISLIREIEVIGYSQPGLHIHTIFLGGGTPSLLTPQQIGNILRAVEDAFVVDNAAEITIEANPNDITLDYALALRDAGVNRLSLGMQSANEHELRLFARRHGNDHIATAVSAVRKAGFNNINLDLIYGIPHQTISDWEWSLRQMLALKPEHISLYALGLEDDTPMKEWVDTGRLPAPDDDLAADMYELATEQLHNAGYLQYEISNWSLPGRMCRHNLQYWRNLPYIGAGPGAHGYAGGVRYATLLSPQRYIRVMQEPGAAFAFPRTPATADATQVDRAGEIAETLIMGLRLTQEGINRTSFRERFGEDIMAIHGPTIEKYVDHGLLTLDADSVCLTQQGRLLSNMIFRELV